MHKIINNLIYINDPLYGNIWFSNIAYTIINKPELKLFLFKKGFVIPINLFFIQNPSINSFPGSQNFSLKLTI